MTADEAREEELVTIPKEQRSFLIPILNESFEGLYLWHSRRTLRGIESVRALRIAGVYVGLSMLKIVAEGAGYVYYIAVSPRFRRKGLGGKLLDDAMSHLREIGANEVFASVEEDNEESNALFRSRGFEQLDENFFSSRYGRLRAFVMSREMMIVPGEVVLRKVLRSASPPPNEDGDVEATSS